MKFRIVIIFLFISSCNQNYNKNYLKTPFTSKGFALIYDDEDFINKKKINKLNNMELQIAHNKLAPGTLIKLTNLESNESIILKNYKKLEYPEFYKILLTKKVADKLNLDIELPLVELIEIKKNKSFIAKKTIIYNEEKKIFSSAPVEIVKIDNITKNIKKKIIKEKKIYIIIAEFYSTDSAIALKKRITQNLKELNSKKLFIKTKKINKITLLSGPYSSINLMKNDYIELKNFGFEELSVTINE